jgi:hypothetical protein
MWIEGKARIAVIDFQDDSGNAEPGRSVAEEVEAHLLTSEVFEVVERKKWRRALGEAELRPNYRFRREWEAGILKRIGVDAVVVGRQERLRDGHRTLSVTVFDAVGSVFEAVIRGSEKELAELLLKSDVVKKIHVRCRPFSAEIQFATGPSLLLNIGMSPGLESEDRVRLERVLEAVPDPYFQGESRVLDHLTGSLGEADVLEVSAGFALVRYWGNAHPKAGDVVRLAKI